MPNLRVLVPEATTNYIKNPSFRYNTTGWIAVGATAGVSYYRARFGVTSCSIVPNGSLIGEGIYYRVSDMPVGECTASIYVRGDGIVKIRLYDAAYGQQWSSKPVAVDPNRWTRLEVTGTSIGGDDMRLYIETTTRVQSVTFYVDGAQMEQNAYATTYCDGDEPGCRWNVIAHSTVSTRPVSTRVGGRWVAVAGPCRGEGDDIYATTMSGFGMPPVQLNTQSYSQLPGDMFQGTKVQSRPVTIQFHTKKEALRVSGKPTLAALHELRQQLVDIFKPDRSSNHEAMLFEYDDGDKPLYMWMRYEAGLTGDWDIRNRWVNSFPVRFLATDPFFYEDNQEIAELTLSSSMRMYLVAGRENGVWSDLNGGFSPLTENVRTSVVGPDGAIYFCGEYYYGNNRTNAIDPKIVLGGRGYWDGTQWQKMSSVGGTSPDIHSMCVAPNGYIYVTGVFSSIGNNPSPATRVAYWDGTQWNAMDSGLNNTGRAICAAPNGDIYVGGDFTDKGNYITRWDGSQFHYIGTSNGLNGAVYSLAMSPDGTRLYVGGTFTDEATPTATMNRVCYYDVANDDFAPMGSGVNSTVRTIAVGPDLQPYIGGDFTASGSDTIWRVARWNGSSWNKLGGGLRGGNVYHLSFDEKGTLGASGWFTSCGGLTVRADQIAYWNNANWYPADFIPDFGTSTTMNITAFEVVNGNIYVGSSTGVSSMVASAMTVVENIGSASVKPVLFINNSGHLRWIENYTTGKKCVFDLDIMENEEITIDFGKATMTSNTRGNVLYSLLAGGDFSDFELVPGENKIILFIHSDTHASAHLSYIPKHWSADAVARDEEL